MARSLALCATRDDTRIRRISLIFPAGFGYANDTAKQDQPDRARTRRAQFGLAAHEAAALSGAVTRFNPPAS